MSYLCSIYSGTYENSELVGTGFYFSHCEKYFCITAKHVVERKPGKDILSISVGKEDRPVYLPKEIKMSKSPADFAIIQLPPQILSCLNEKKFLNINQMDLSEDLENDWYVMCGFPHVQSISKPKEIISNPLFYGTVKADELPKSKIGAYSKTVNFPFAYPESGNQRTQGGEISQINVIGVSGGPIFKTNIGHKNRANWSFGDSRIISLVHTWHVPDGELEEDQVQKQIVVGTKIKEVMHFIEMKY